jgi:hypothetical protein
MFVITLLMNVVTLAVTATATMRRPTFSYRLISGLAIYATGFSLHQVVTGCVNIFATPLTALLVIAMLWRIGLNFGGARRKTPRRKL